jgi:3-oxoacyl-[acyl-carrier protein] reductase
MAIQTNPAALAGRSALITGAGTPIGSAVARALARAGAGVTACDVNPTRADAVAESITADGGQAIGWGGDVANKFQVGSMIEHLRDVYGGLHIVVNAWWVNKQQPVLTLDEYDWRRVIEVNLTGTFLVSQLAARVMADEGGGAIVMLIPPEPDDPGLALPYAVSRGGLAALGQALQAGLDGQGVRVVSLPVSGQPEAVAAAVLAAV